MAESQIKVSSIMFTDIVGYSKMVSKDENHALQLLDSLRAPTPIFEN